MPTFDLAQALDIPKLPNYLKLVDERLRAVAREGGMTLKQSLLQTVKAKSKRLRPALVLGCAEADTVNESLVSAATAIELLHLGSLLHDDVIDNATSRWGRPSINAAYGLPTAILAGDYLLAQAGSQAAKVSAQAALIIADTIAQLSAGESQEIAGRFNLNRTQADYFKCLGLKTGTLMSAACRLGAICSGWPTKRLDALATFGFNLGISFQIIDDVLDVVSTPQLMGKPVGNDAAQGIYTLPVLLSLSGNRREQIEAILKQADQQSLADLLMNNQSIAQSIVVAKQYNYRAAKALTDFSSTSSKNLASLPAAYLEWSLTNLVAYPKIVS